MARLPIKYVILLLSSAVLLACNTQKQVELEVSLSVKLDGKPASGAEVLIDGTAAGQTDTEGKFISRLKRLPGQEVSLAVQQKASGYDIKPWQKAFVAKLADKGIIERYPFNVNLTAKKFITLTVAAGDEPIEGATVYLKDRPVGQTDANGNFVHTYTSVPKSRFDFSVRKKGYRSWKKSVLVEPGEEVEIALKKKTVQPADRTEEPEPAASSKRVKTTTSKTTATLTISTKSDAYGVTRPLSGVAVSINAKQRGKTDAKGRFVYRYTGTAGRKVALKLSAPGHIPGQWETKVALKGKRTVQRHFYPAKPPVIQIGMYGYINNSPEESIEENIAQVEEAVRKNLFIYRSFKEVPKPRLHEMMLQDTLDMETVSTKGWQNAGMSKKVDMILSGSVTKDRRGLTIESTLTTADGKILLSQINTASSTRDIPRTAKIIASGIIDQFPFEGTITAVEEDGYRINLGQHNYKIRRGNIFRYMAAQRNRSGRISGYKEEGLLRVIETADTSSKVEIASLNEKHKIQVGDKVIRRVYLEEERESAKNAFVLMASGGTAGNSQPLWGVNVYLNNTWMGTTRDDGKVSIPVHLYEQYELLLSRHGYQPVQTTVSISQDKAVQSYTLEIANALLKIESEPSQADVYIDDTLIGRTPILDGKLVNFGFRKLRLSVGGDYRDWQRVVEFNKPEVAFTGHLKIHFLKDYFKIGQMAEQNGRIDEAIQAYGAIERQNPDYSDARHRLAQLYMDEKGDYAKAIQEFEKVLALPENKQIIYKQFAVTYTNLGHAYYEMGNQLIWKDKTGAARNFANAISKLKIAKQNTRFFPTAEYSQAVHDTYYYLAISSHKLYLLTKKSHVLNQANQAWREYFDFYPKQLEGNGSFEKIRKAARQYWRQIKELS
ncbi:MAG: PEGA domain-containing protein [Desulfobacteraceae bacterium]|jgi:tetratricopeptide (TPR) repeat protein